MIRRFDNLTVYTIKGARNGYQVILDRLNNDRNGNPRYKAIIIPDADEPRNDGNQNIGIVYHFSGHYYGNTEEARFIVEYHEKKMEA